MPRSLLVPSVLTASILLACGACTTEVESPWQERGYNRTETQHDTVSSVTQIAEGQWDVGLGKSARSYRILRELSPEADEVVARARELQASKQPAVITIVVHDTAPRTKAPLAGGAADASGSSAGAPWPWVIVWLEPELAPPAERGR